MSFVLRVKVPSYALPALWVYLREESICLKVCLYMCEFKGGCIRHR